MLQDRHTKGKNSNTQRSSGNALGAPASAGVKIGGRPGTWVGGAGMSREVLDKMGIPQLHALFLKTFNHPTGSNNGEWLRKKLAQPLDPQVGAARAAVPGGSTGAASNDAPAPEDTADSGGRKGGRSTAGLKAYWEKRHRLKRERIEKIQPHGAKGRANMLEAKRLAREAKPKFDGPTWHCTHFTKGELAAVAF